MSMFKMKFGCSYANCNVTVGYKYLTVRNFVTNKLVYKIKINDFVVSKLQEIKDRTEIRDAARVAQVLDLCPYLIY